MLPDFAHRLRALAEVVVRVGLNLQPGQPLLITDPYELQGVHSEALGLAAAVKAAAGTETTILPADPVRLRALVESDDTRGYEALVSDHTRRLRLHLARGGAFLFLTGSAPQLFAGLPAERLARFETAKWRRFGPVVQQLIAGASQCCLIPAPTAAWAGLAGVSLSALWEIVFQALRIDSADGDPVSAWRAHLAALEDRCNGLNAAHHRTLRYTGPGTDLVLELPRSHRWCTTQLRTHSGVPFVFNLPTEEVFSAPHKNSARGTVRVARPVAHGGTVMTGIELEFRRGRVVTARAEYGIELLRELLATDAGASRLGEVALIPQPGVLARANRVFHHILLDENAAPHIALGCAYRFCSRAWLPLAINPSQLHLDLPLDAEVELV